jgi:Tfp pilus assembly protein PilF
VLLEATATNPTDFTLHFMLGTAYQFQHKLDLALKTYLYAESLDNASYSLKGNIASTYQGLGMAKEALRYYEMALPHSVGDAGLYNNYGALLGIMGRDDEQAVWLEKALEIKPTLLPALINLAGYYQDEGDLGKAREMTRRAREASALSIGVESMRSA